MYPYGVPPIQIAGPSAWRSWEVLDAAQEIVDAAPTGSPFPIHPLADSAESLRAEIAKLKICLVIVDSQSQAAGSIGQGDPAIRVRELVRTVNSFSVTTLLISQVSKVESRYQGTREPCGSRHLSYLADDTWELRATSDPENRRLTTVLHHRKHRGPWHPPLAFTADFPEEGVVRLTDAPVPDDIETSGRTQQHRSDRPPAGQQAAQVAIIAQLGEATPTQVAQYLRPKEAGKPTRLPAPARPHRLDPANSTGRPRGTRRR